MNTTLPATGCSTPHLSRATARAMIVGLALLTAALPSSAQLVEVDDLGLPASPDGFNLTQDLTTGLEWLDVTVSVGRSFDDLIGTDGSDEFAPGGDFEGFRHATFLELTGWTGGPQADSLFINFGFNSQFSSIGPYGSVQDYLSYVGCLGACGTYGYISGIYVLDLVPPLDPRWSKGESFASSGHDWGQLHTGFTSAPTSWPVNGSSTDYGHFLVRPLPEPGSGLALTAGSAGVAWLARRKRRRLDVAGR